LGEVIFAMTARFSLFDFNEPVAAKLGSEHRLVAADPANLNAS
jgi:hypothetical protein